jgi:3-oxoadipate enol-lactonase
VSVAYRLDGPDEKPTLVLSSSLGTTTDLWNAQIPALEHDCRVVRYDHPGHGRSALPREPLTVDALAQDVIDLLDRLGLERVSFCGLSLGGMVGIALALQAPERIERLALCCTAAYLGPPEGWHERAQLVRSAGTAAVAERVLERWFTERFRDTHPATVTRFRTMLERTSSEGYAACCEAIALWDARSRLGTIGAPTLVISGAEDVATPPEDGAFLAESIPHAELAVLPDAAHLANVAQPELFAEALLGHLSLRASSEAPA